MQLVAKIATETMQQYTISNQTKGRNTMELKVRADFDEITEALTDEEKSRLLLAMIRYAKDRENVPTLTGNERILWPVFRVEIDHDRAVIETWTENGKKGGRPRKNDNQTEPNETQNNQNKPNETQNNQTEPKNNLVFEEEESEREREKEKRTKREKEIEKDKEEEHGNARAQEISGNLFDLFWTEYPRKEGKKAARKEWDRLRPSETLLQDMLNSLHKQKNSDQWTRDGGQYIPHPATWLHGERWKDETVMPARASPRNIAQSYSQRDYNGEDKDALNRMLSMAVIS